MYIDIYRYRYTDIYVDIYIDIYFYDEFFNHQYRLCFTTRLPAVPDLFDSGRNVGALRVYVSSHRRWVGTRHILGDTLFLKCV